MGFAVAGGAVGLLGEVDVPGLTVDPGDRPAVDDIPGEALGLLRACAC
jgi:hypothetical protein